jgi:hypothetical protein
LCVGLAASVDLPEARQAASGFLNGLGYTGGIDLLRDLGEDDPQAWVFELEPQGYVVVSASYDLPPVLAYSFTSLFAAPDGDLLADLLAADIANRLASRDPASVAKNRAAWDDIPAFRDGFQQWPPAGYSATEGWITTEWDQSAPYNNDCPIDPVTQQRSLAGCPAVAMAQIVNYHQCLNGTVFSDVDDYYHNYSGRTFWVDDDHALHDFPAWTELNSSLGDLTYHYSWMTGTTDADAAALVWACGAAAEQVYTSEGSGTFGVNQAFAAYQRFGFDGSELLAATAPDLYDRMAQNVRDGLPVHLAVVTPAWDAGHNVAVDGYNTNGFFHLNFGWGGPYSGWYLLPDQIPYNLTVIEGAIVDIEPRQYLFSVPDTLDMRGCELNEEFPLELINISDVSLAINSIWPLVYFASENAGMYITPADAAPCTLQPGQSLLLNVVLCVVDKDGNRYREPSSPRIWISHEYSSFYVPVLLDSIWFVSLEDEVRPPAPAVVAAPNPFQERLELKLDTPGNFQADIYNLKGQKIASLEGSDSLVWEPEPGLPAGIYLARVRSASGTSMKRVCHYK